ncbi:hypothetical protein [Micromonospora sp. WMMC273]|uniref:hypothetical protein n=1 Tax=Micromonospora sp. WMMC273 TaxID=3015157 RepID=UPI0022B6D508|nr:hypothetical protein [Micromonospora sp. WMMC273]MCZ7478818.1 hypothetical protein [Micromonospora sp. WMMC273]MCZ7478946.1 hypothetical protein [Micromonospora sp. WMMC273]
MRTDVRWTAVLAPLNVASTDHRLLTLDFTLTAHTPLALLEDLPHAPVIGTVDDAEVHQGIILAHGTLTDPATATRMSSGELRPQIDLHDTTVTHRDGLTVFHSGLLGAVRAGTRPVWPAARFHID